MSIGTHEPPPGVPRYVPSTCAQPTRMIWDRETGWHLERCGRPCVREAYPRELCAEHEAANQRARAERNP